MDCYFLENWMAILEYKYQGSFPLFLLILLFYIDGKQLY